jgi:hypothetical protein
VHGCTSSMSSSKRENIEQIPKVDNLGDVQKAVSEQGGVEGQRKEVNVGDYASSQPSSELPTSSNILATDILLID